MSEDVKKYSLEWFKEKVVESLVGIVVMGVVGLVGFAFVQAYLGDYKNEKMKSDLQIEIKKMKNETVEREAEIMKAIQQLKDQKTGTATPPPAPDEHPDSVKLKWLESHREK